MRLTTVTHEFEQPIRHINQMASGGSYVAFFTLRLAPSREAPEVQFSNEVSKPEVEAWIVSAIERGIRDFIGQRERDGKPVGYLRVALVDIRVHLLDSKAWAFTQAAFMAMTQAFEAHETLLMFETH